MNDDIAQIMEFYDRCGPEAAGRGLIGLETRLHALIERFIIGHCDEAERYELARFLQLNPAWIRRIADRIKGLREVSEQAAGESSH